MIYVCSVYSIGAFSNSEKHKELRQKRYEYTKKMVAKLISGGNLAISPIVHNHEIAEQYNLPMQGSYWKEYNEQLMTACSSIYVLKMPHWEESLGIAHELDYAVREDIPVVFISCDDYEEGELEGVAYAQETL